jgi:thymidylate synthase (FAD)
MTVKVTEPKVYVVAHTQLNRVDLEGTPGLVSFLESEGCTEEDDISKRSGLYGEQVPSDEDTECDLLPELAGRVCYGSYGRKKDTNERYIGHIIEVGHGSVCEHSTITLAFTGISRSLTHELVRHRAGFGYSQRSQRFVNESDFQIVMPPLFQEEGFEELADLVQETSEYVHDQYKLIADKAMERLGTPEVLVNFAIRERYLTNNPALVNAPDTYVVDNTAYLNESWNQPNTKEWWVEYLTHSGDAGVRKKFEAATRTARRKTAREAARSVLPNCTETKIFVTGNLRAWRGMLDQRASIHADREIRHLALMTLNALQETAPNVFGDYQIKVDSFGNEYAETQYRKV